MTPYTITASKSPISFSASGLPSGITVNPSIGTISGTPAGLTGGVYSIPFATNVPSTIVNYERSATVSVDNGILGEVAATDQGSPFFTLLKRIYQTAPGILGPRPIL